MEFTVGSTVYDDEIKYLVGHQYNEANRLLAKVDVATIMNGFGGGEDYGNFLNEFITSQGDPEFLIGIAACVFKPKDQTWKHDEYDKYKEDLGYADVKYLLHGLGFFLKLSPITPDAFNPFIEKYLMLKSGKQKLKKTG